MVLWRLLRRAPEPEDDPFPESTGPDAVITTFFEIPCLLLYAYIAFVFLAWGVWWARRCLSSMLLTKQGALGTKVSGSAYGGRNGSFGGTRFGSASNASGDLSEPLLSRRKPEKPLRKGPLCAHTMTDIQGRVVTFEGYCDSKFGALASKLVPMTSVMFLALFGVVLYDYYSGCSWEWPEQLCYIGNFPLFGTFNTNSYVFMVLWGTSISWFGLLVCGRNGQMGNLFRLRAPLNRAKYVHVTMQEKEQSISSGRSRLLEGIARAVKAVGKKLGLGVLPGGVFGLSGMPSQTMLLRYDSDLKIHFIEFRCVRYVLDPEYGFTQYNPAQALNGGHAQYLRILEAGGLRTSGRPGGDIPTQDEMFRGAGSNRIPFEVDRFITAIAEEFATFFFLYQFAIYAVCLWFSYWHYTIIALTVAGVSGIFNVVVRISSQREIKGMMEQNTRVKVMRGGQAAEVDVDDVVPGDIVKVEGDNWLVPCDLLLLKGAAVCDESTLTGEAMPVQRLSPAEMLKESETADRPPAKHVLVAGTTVLQVSGEECWAIATHTGTNTQKGQLLLLILYPPKLLFKYDEQLAVVFCLLIAYAMGVMYTVMKVMYERYATEQNLPITATWASAVFTCSCVLPTMLHIVLSVGQVVAAQRLKDKEVSVFCAAPKRIALAGKVRVACFDKTGTLTESSLKFFGVHCTQLPPTPKSGPFGGRLGGTREVPELEAEARSDKWEPEVLHALASTHSLSPFSGSEAGVVGNAVEVNMFVATGWKLATQSEVWNPNEKSSGPTLRILKRFDFSHSTMTMSSCIQHMPTGQRCIYAKGSFEQVMKLCKPESVPKDYTKVAQAHAYSGMYVLAIAGKVLSKAVQVPETREEAERDLVLLGLLLFKNPLRKDTRATIERLREGEVRSVMITGDAAGTAIRIAKEAALVTHGVPVLLGDLPADASPGEGVCWRCQEEDLTALNELLLGNDWLTWRKNYKQWRMGQGSGARGEASTRARKAKKEEATLTLERRSTWPSVEAAMQALAEEEPPLEEEEYAFSTEELVLSRLFEWCELAVTQRAYEWLQNTPCTPDLRRVLMGSRQASLKKGRALSSGKGNSSLAWELLTSIRIFARATPMGKISVVEGLMSQNLICAMCGDGGNDSGALRTAHVGMALSNATSATVVAPFTTNRASVAPIADLIREGRAALATSFAGYKYCIHYGLLNSFFKFQTYYHGVGQAMSARYLQDLIGFLSFSWAITLSRPAKNLVGETPTSSLFSVVTWASVVGMWVMNMYAIHIGMALMSMHPDYVQFPVHKVLVTEWWKLSRNWETNLLFFFYTFQQFWSAVVFSFGSLFRLSWYANLVLLALFSSGFAFLIFLALSQANTLTRIFHLMYEEDIEHPPWSPEEPCPAMPLELRLGGLALLLGNMLVTGVFEQVIIQGSVGVAIRNALHRYSKHITLRL